MMTTQLTSPRAAAASILVRAKRVFAEGVA
jgi:hypothetical protein